MFEAETTAFNPPRSWVAGVTFIETQGGWVVCPAFAQEVGGLEFEHRHPEFKGHTFSHPAILPPGKWRWIGISCDKGWIWWLAFCSLNPHPNSFLENERCLCELPTVSRTPHSESFIDFFYYMVAILPTLHKPSKTSLMRSPKQLAGVMILQLFCAWLLFRAGLVPSTQGRQRELKLC